MIVQLNSFIIYNYPTKDKSSLPQMIFILCMDYIIIAHDLNRSLDPLIDFQVNSDSDHTLEYASRLGRFQYSGHIVVFESITVRIYFLFKSSK